RRGRPPRIDLDKVVDAAVAIIERDGLDALTLRRVAADLGITPTPLYRLVATKDELLDLAVEGLLRRHGVPLVWPTEWDEVLRLAAVRLRDVLMAHPAILHAMQRRPITTPTALEGMES